jgi:RimJ/RimL family protein N-acetyltransferase
MLLGSRISIGPFVPEDFAAVFCWVNDVGAARLDLAYRPIDMMTHQQWWQGLGKDPSKVVFAIRKTGDPAIIGFVQIAGINSVHRSAEIGIRIGEEKNRGQGYGKDGFRKEGCMRKAAFIGGDWVDLILMAALRPAQSRRPRSKGSAAQVVALTADSRSIPDSRAA